jgi:hypothetical protein
VTAKEIDYLTVDDLLEIAAGVLDEVMLRDAGLLAAASGRPRVTIFGAEAYPTFEDKAAALRCGRRWGDGLSGSGRSRAATAPVGRWRSGCWRTASTCSRCWPSWSAGARLFDTGHNRKTDAHDAHDAHAVAVVAARTNGLQVLSYDGELEALRMLADRREVLTRTRVQTVNRLQRLLAELTPGKAKRDITALQQRQIVHASRAQRSYAQRTPGPPTNVG